LRATKVAGYPLEWFAPLADAAAPMLRKVTNVQDVRDFQLQFHSAPSDTEFIERISNLGSSDNGVFGVKLHLGQIPDAKRRLRGHLGDSASRLDALLLKSFPNLSFVWLRRRDKVAQAISFYRAIETGEFLRRPHESSKGSPRRSFDLNSVYRYAETLTGEDSAWQQIFELCGIRPLEIFYEDFTAAYQPTIQAVLSFLGIQRLEADELVPGLVRQADELSAECHRQFLARWPRIEADKKELLLPWVMGLLH